MKAFVVGIILIAGAVAALRAMLPKDGRVHRLATESRLRKFEQVDKWSFCLTAGTLMPANQERR